MPSTAKLTDKGTQHDSYYETVIAVGPSTVFTDGLPATRQEDPLALHDKPKHPPHPRKVAGGLSTVSIGGPPAVRAGDVIDCGGVVTSGGTINIGWYA